MDINNRRLNLLKTAAKAQGVRDLIKIQGADVQKYAADVVKQADDKQQQQQQYQFDKVLVDAPCSGLGVLAKRCATAASLSFVSKTCQAAALSLQIGVRTAKYGCGAEMSSIN